MKVTQESSKIIKPIYHDNPPPTTDYIPLSVFDKVTYNFHVPIIYAYHPPTPSNAVMELGLRKVLAVYRECAGRFGKDEKLDPIILLNDEGARLIEASVDSPLDKLMPFSPSELLTLQPNVKDVEELVLVQLTKFTCGSIVVGFTSHHLLGDGQSASKFLVSWGQACRGIEINPMPFHDRTIFSPRNPPSFEFDHKKIEFMSENTKNDNSLGENTFDDIVLQKAHFTLEFLGELKSKASSLNNNKQYSTFESLVAHLWRVLAKARALPGYEITNVKISVNGRNRMSPRVPAEYFGNLVRWAFPNTKVKDLLGKPLPYAANLIRDSVAKVNNNYFKSFIDFSNFKVKEEKLVPAVEKKLSALSPNMEVHSWLTFPFYDLDLGGGSPFMFMPSYLPTEGVLFLVPSFLGDGSIDAFVTLFKHNIASFKNICYSLDLTQGSML